MLLTRSFYNPAMLRSDLRRTWPLLGGYTLIWLLFLPLRLMRALDGVAPKFAAQSIQVSIEEAMYASTWINLFAGLILAASLFSYLSSPRATYGLHSLPVSRGCQFRTHVLCGVGGVVCCNVVIAALTILVQLGGSVNWGMTMTWLVCATVSLLLFFALGVVCCMLCGWLPGVVVAYGGLNGVAAVVKILISTLCSIFYPSYNDSWHDISYDGIVTWLTPILRLQYSLNDVALYARDTETADLTAMWQSLLVYGIAAVVLLVAACLLYTVRRSERSGDTVAFKPLRPVVRWAAGLLGGLGLGIVFASLIGSPEEFSLLLICTVVLGLACMTGAQMLLAKTPKVFKKLWPELLALWLVIAALCTCMEKDAFGYERRIPKASQVESVEVVYMWFGGYKTSDPDEIDTILQTHAYLQENSDDSMKFNISSLILSYSLKDGSTLSRRYYVGDIDRARIQNLLETASFRRSVVMSTWGDVSVEALRTGYYDLGGQQTELTQEQARALYNAILDDAAAMDMTSVDLYEGEQCRMDIRVKNLDGSVQADLYLNRQCTRTLQLLQDWGIIESPDEIFVPQIIDGADDAQASEAALLD